MKRNTWLMLLTFIMFLSCGRQKGDNELLPIVKEWYGKEVKFPDHPVFTLYGKDTVDYSIPQFVITSTIPHFNKNSLV